MTKPCLAPYEIQEGDLLAYLEGEATPEVTQHIRRCPACMAEVEWLRMMTALFSEALQQPAVAAVNPRWVRPGQVSSPRLANSAKRGPAESRRYVPHFSSSSIFQTALAFVVGFLLIGYLSATGFYRAESYEIEPSPPAVQVTVEEKPSTSASPVEFDITLMAEAARPEKIYHLKTGQVSQAGAAVVTSQPKAATGTQQQKLNHPPLIRANAVRVLVAPQFIAENHSEIAPPLELRRNWVR